MEIRKLSVEDCIRYKDELVNFIYESNLNCALNNGYSIENAKNKFQELKQYIFEDKAIVYGAITQDILCGFVWAYKSPFREDINRLYVSIIHVGERHRSKSVGKQLLFQLEKEAIKIGYRAIYLHAEAENKGALRFYEREGFEKERIQLVKSIDNCSHKRTGGVTLLSAEDVMKNKDILVYLVWENTRVHSFVNEFDMEDARKKVEGLAQYLEEEKAIVYGVLKEEKLVGFTWYYPYNYRGENRFYIGMTEILKEYRGMGFGTMLYNAAIARINELGGKVIYTHIDADNTTSLGMHYKNGFEDENYQLVKYL